MSTPLRATFSPAHPLTRRDAPLARARGVCDRALREHRGLTGLSLFLVAGFVNSLLG